MKQGISWTRHTRIAISLICLTLGIGLAGCGRISVYVLNQDEIMMLKKGETITAPYDGTFYSQRAEKRVMDAKVITTKLK